MVTIPSDVTDQAVEALRRHYKPDWGVQAHRRFQSAYVSPDGADPRGWILSFVSHT
jgi:hypothetical protein